MRSAGRMPSRDYELAVELLASVSVDDQRLSWRIPCTAARAENVAALDAETLERLVGRVIAERRWPDDA